MSYLSFVQGGLGCNIASVIKINRASRSIKVHSPEIEHFYHKFVT